MAEKRTREEHPGKVRNSRLVSKRAVLEAALDLQVPALPRTVRLVHALTADRNADARAIANAIQTDCGITLRFFRVMNSAFFSPYRQDILSIRFMVVLLGMDNTSKVVASVPLMNLEEEREAAKVMGLCLLASEIAAGLSEASSLHGETVVPCAMFAPLGHLVLASVIPDSYRRLWQDEKFPWSRNSFKRTTGWLPKELGLRVARAWNLPMLMRECIMPPEDISRLSQEKQTLFTTVSSIEQLLFCAALMANRDDVQLRLRDRLKKTLKLSNKKMTAVMKRAVERFDERSPVFSTILREQGILSGLLI